MEEHASHQKHLQRGLRDARLAELGKSQLLEEHASHRNTHTRGLSVVRQADLRKSNQEGGKASLPMYADSLMPCGTYSSMCVVGKVACDAAGKCAASHHFAPFTSKIIVHCPTKRIKHTCAAFAIQVAMPTSQLARMPFTSVAPQPSLTCGSAIFGIMLSSYKMNDMFD